MIRSFLTTSTGTLASRLAGFLRDSLIAAALGTGAVADAFLLAFQLVNVARRLLSEGALNAALVPAWSRVRSGGGAEAAAAFAGRVLGTVSVILILTAVLIGLLMPQIIAVLAPGFAGSTTLRLAVTDAQLMLPYLAFAGPVTVLMALLNAQGRVALTAFSPLLFNIALIATIAVLLIFRTETAFAAWVLAGAVGIAGGLQLVVLLARRSARLARPLSISFGPDMRSFLRQAIPGMLASSAPQWLMVAGAIIASTMPSAVSWLYFANRLIELPLGIVGVAMGTVLVPELTRAVGEADSRAITQAESRALELAAGLALPAMVGLIALSEPIVRLLFERGAFSATDSAATALALAWLALGLPAHVLIKALAPAFYARHDTLTPLVATTIGIAVTITAAVPLAHFFGATGVAAGIAAGAWSSALSLVRQGGARFGFSIDGAAFRRLPRIAIATSIMGGLLWSTMGLVPAASHGLLQLAVVCAQMAGAVLVYGVLLHLFGVATWRDAVNAIRKPRPAQDAELTPNCP